MREVRLEVFRNLFASVAEEMGWTLGRAAYSVNIKERKDFSCAIFDPRGRMIAQAAHIPVHLGSMPLSVEAAVGVGDLVILNDPYRGGTHLPDVTLVRRVPKLGYVACRAHYSDIGGMSPGSMPVSTDLHQEGLVIPPLPLTPEVRAMLLANVRNPRDVEGDLDAQTAACRIGAARFAELAARHPDALRWAGALQDYARRRMIAAIRKLPRGTVRFEDALDGGIRIRAAVTRRGDGVTVDFTGSSPQVEGNVNAVFAVTLSAVLYCFRCLVPEDIPMNAGAASPIRVIAPPGSVVNARPPAAVTAGNVETSQRIVDVVLGALGRVAASQGTMNNVSFGGSGFSYYETIGGGMGARPGRPGVSGVHTHMTNTRNTPIEAFERAYPVRITAYRLRRGSGGAGTYRGGDGIVREYEFGSPAEVSILTDRRETEPYGRMGGRPGARGRNLLDGRPIPGRAQFRVRPGQRLRIETPGGGGWGRPGL